MLKIQGTGKNLTQFAPYVLIISGNYPLIGEIIIYRIFYFYGKIIGLFLHYKVREKTGFKFYACAGYFQIKSDT